jgi:GNAT superfamily N-acetyltransferase
MQGITLTTEPYPPKAWTETVQRGVDQHNIAVTGLPDYYPVDFFIRGAGGEVMGGLTGDIWGGWLNVGSLWVEESLRGRGYASALIQKAEAYAIEKGCSDSFLQTGSFEARPLYEKLGYQVYAELKDHPRKPHSRYFMTKRLTADAQMHRSKQLDLKINREPDAPAQAAQVIKSGIFLHAGAALGLPENTTCPFGFFLRDIDGEVLGGAFGNLWGDWLFVETLWVDRQLRGRGHATKLMAAAEQHASARGCSNAFLDTFSFQARPLYEKLGYQVIGELKDFPKGHSRYWMAKHIAK